METQPMDASHPVSKLVAGGENAMHSAEPELALRFFQRALEQQSDHEAALDGAAGTMLSLGDAVSSYGVSEEMKSPLCSPLRPPRDLDRERTELEHFCDEAASCGPSPLRFAGWTWRSFWRGRTPSRRTPKPCPC
eukprot:scaffold293_cov248-Pinguiococcus_pyrenoidosus.AAC.12